jgi:hypothetical protein
MNKNYWGEPDDYDNDLPDWMRAETYRNGNQLKRQVKSLEEACRDALKKPAIDVSKIQLNENER